jgi:hypothetical protein
VLIQSFHAYQVLCYRKRLDDKRPVRHVDLIGETYESLRVVEFHLLTQVWTQRHSTLVSTQVWMQRHYRQTKDRTVNVRTVQGPEKKMKKLAFQTKDHPLQVQVQVERQTEAFQNQRDQTVVVVVLLQVDRVVLLQGDRVVLAGAWVVEVGLYTHG